jgi:hypothetical protein
MDDETKRYHTCTHKFGIDVPKSWDNCIRLETENDNTRQQDAVRNEIKNVRVALDIMNRDQDFRPTYREIHCNMIFDVKMEEFWRNAHFFC